MPSDPEMQQGDIISQVRDSNMSQDMNYKVKNTVF